MKPESCLILSFEYSTTSKFLTRLFKDRCDWIIRPLKNYNIRFVLCGENIPIIHKKKKGKKYNKFFKSGESSQRWYILESPDRSGLLAKIKRRIKVQQWQQIVSNYLQRGGIRIFRLQMSSSCKLLQASVWVFTVKQQTSVAPRDDRVSAEPRQSWLFGCWGTCLNKSGQLSRCMALL